MSQKKNFTCSICSKKHTIYSYLEGGISSLLKSIPEKEKEQRVVQNEELQIWLIDKESILVKGILPFYIDTQEEPIMSWSEIWVKITKENYLEAMNNLEKTKHELLKMKGQLDSDLIFFYQQTIGLEVEVLFQSSINASVLITITEDSEVKNDTASPMTYERFIELQTRMCHFPHLKGISKVFSKSAKNRQMEILKNAEQEYVQNGNDFLIDVSISNLTVLQIIGEATEFKGFIFHLPFQVNDDKKDRERFLQNEFSSLFTENQSQEGIIEYQLRLIDKNKIIRITESLITEVYQRNFQLVEFEISEF